MLAEGATIAASGIVAGAVAGAILARTVGSYIQGISMPGLLPTIGAAALLIAAAVLASLTPAARASRVDVSTALRSE